ncbi:MAG: crotonase/enoyl-CoA hydratase family protein [Myxococcota bacterium]
MTELIQVERQGEVTIVTINRPEVRNAVNPETARLLADAFIAFDGDDTSSVAVFDGAQGTFCAGADLKAVAEADMVSAYKELTSPVPRDGRGPMGPSYLRLSKPVIAAVAGHAVAGGLELSLWCDLRVVEEDAIFGVYCRRWGVPLIDGGTVRLPRIVGHGHAMDMILTGRPVDAQEARMMGLANKVVPKGMARQEAITLAEQLSRFPQTCMRNDRASAYEQWDLDFDEAMANESRHGLGTLRSQETVMGAARFVSGRGRSGRFDDI